MKDNEKSISAKDRRLERERQQRREAIIETAEEFFLNEGYENAMVDQIALQAGYSKATIYNYFESKEDLFTAVIAETFEKLFQILENMFKNPNVKRNLRVLGDAYLVFVEKYPAHAGLFDEGRLSFVITRIIQKEETSQVLTESEKEFRTHQLKIQDLMISIITDTMKDAEIKSKIDPFAVVMVLSTLNSAIRELVMRSSRTDQPEKKAKEYLEILFNIIDKGLKHYDD